MFEPPAELLLLSAMPQGGSGIVGSPRSCLWERAWGVFDFNHSGHQCLSAADRGLDVRVDLVLSPRHRKLGRLQCLSSRHQNASQLTMPDTDPHLGSGPGCEELRGHSSWPLSVSWGAQ